MKQLIPVDEVDFKEKGQISSKFSGEPFQKFNIDLQAHVDVGASNTLALAGAHSLIQLFELRQGQETLVSLAGPELKALSILEPADAEALNPTSHSSTNQPLKATASIDFAKLGPVGSMVDAGIGANEVYASGRFGELVDAGSGYSAPTGGRNGKLRPWIETVDRIPAAGYFAPSIVSTHVDLGAGPSTRTTWKFQAEGAQGGVLMGFLVRQYDDSAKATGIDAASTDKLVRRIRASVTSRRWKGIAAEFTWGQAKRAFAKYFKPQLDTNGKLPSGIGFIPIIDDTGAASLRGGLAMGQGDNVEISLDTSSEMEEEFGTTGVTAASGDQAIITPIFFRRVLPSGVETVPAGANAAAPVSAAQAGRASVRRRRPRRRPRR
jgi:hypothetical protein